MTCPKSIDIEIAAFNTEIEKLKLRMSELNKYSEKLDELKNMNYEDFDISNVENNHEEKKKLIRKVVESITIYHTTMQCNEIKLHSQATETTTITSIKNDTKAILFKVKLFGGEGFYTIYQPTTALYTNMKKF